MVTSSGGGVVYLVVVLLKRKLVFLEKLEGGTALLPLLTNHLCSLGLLCQLSTGRELLFTVYTHGNQI